MAHEVIFRCDRDRCLAEEHVKFVLTGEYLGLPPNWIEIRQGDYGTKLMFCSWVCADDRVNEAAEAENAALAEEQSPPH